MNELELKFRLPEPAVAALAATLEAHGAQTIRLQAKYFDTDDGALARRRAALRLRREGPRWVQAFKADGASAVHRLEHEVQLPLAAGKTPQIDPRRHDGTPAEAVLRDALGDPPAPLAERLSTDVKRLRTVFERADGARVEVALDIGEVRGNGRAAAIAELELEHLNGPLDALFDLARGWAGQHGMWLSTVSKAARGERLSGDAPVVATKARPPRLPPRPRGTELVAAVVNTTLDQVLANGSEVAEGNTDPHVIHQLRVGLRRLRTALREIGARFVDVDPAWDEALARTFRQLGELRDQETVVAAVRPLLEAAGVDAPALPGTATVDAATAVRAAPFQLALVGLLGLVHGVSSATDASAGPKAAQRWVEKRLDQLHRQVRRDGARFDALSIERQHRVRKRLKRLRYLAEFVAPLWSEKDVDRYLKRLSVAQDALGAHNDVAVGAAMYGREWDNARHARAAGYLQGHLDVTARDAHRALGRVGNKRKFWPK